MRKISDRDLFWAGATAGAVGAVCVAITRAWYGEPTVPLMVIGFAGATLASTGIALMIAYRRGWREPREATTEEGP